MPSSDSIQGLTPRTHGNGLIQAKGLWIKDLKMKSPWIIRKVFNPMTSVPREEKRKEKTQDRDKSQEQER